MRTVIAHRTDETDTRDAVSQAFQGADATPYFAEDHIEGKNLSAKLVEAIGSANAMLVLWTNRVAQNIDTRDIVNTEIGVAAGFGKRVFVFAEAGTEVPLFVKNLTDYHPFGKAELQQLTSRIKDLLQALQADPKLLTTDDPAAVPPNVPTQFRKLYASLDRASYVLDVVDADGEPLGPTINAKILVDELIERLRKGERPMKFERSPVADLVEQAAGLKAYHKIADGAEDLLAVVQELRR